MIKSFLKLAARTIEFFFTAILLIYLIYVLQFKNTYEIPSVLGLRFMTVLSGSMMPSIKPGDIIIDKTVDPKNIKRGDIITYSIGGGIFITHRVIDIIDDKGTIAFKTRGDANNTSDPILVKPEQIKGTVMFKIPYAGYAANFIKSPYGYTALMIIPSVLFIVFKLKNTITIKH